MVIKCGEKMLKAISGMLSAKKYPTVQDIKSLIGEDSDESLPCIANKLYDIFSNNTKTEYGCSGSKYYEIGELVPYIVTFNLPCFKKMQELGLVERENLRGTGHFIPEDPWADKYALTPFAEEVYKGLMKEGYYKEYEEQERMRIEAGFKELRQQIKRDVSNDHPLSFRERVKLSADLKSIQSDFRDYLNALYHSLIFRDEEKDK